MVCLLLGHLGDVSGGKATPIQEILQRSGAEGERAGEAAQLIVIFTKQKKRRENFKRCQIGSV